MFRPNQDEGGLGPLFHAQHDERHHVGDIESRARLYEMMLRIKNEATLRWLREQGYFSES